VATHVAHAAVDASLVALAIPILTGAAGNLASDSIKHLVKNSSNTAEQAFKNEEEAERILLEAVAVATKASLEYNKTESKEALDRYVEASARAKLAYNFINLNNGSQVSIG
jgi:methionyl-tRNA synthetase